MFGITDTRSANMACGHGLFASLFVGIIGILVTTFVLITKAHIESINILGYCDAFIFLIIAWRIKHRSRFFAVAGLCFFTMEKVYQFSHFQDASAGIVMAIILFIGFINGVRGTFAFHRLSQQSESTHNT